MESHYEGCVCDTSFSAHKEIHGLETGEHNSYGKHVNME